LKPKDIKTKRCKVCKTEFAPWNTIQPTCGKFKCLETFAIAHANKVAKLREKRERQALREAKERIKPRKEWLDEAQRWVNKFVRLRDADQPCISCQRFHTGQYHAGHYRTVGACPELRFEESQIHKQCSACNNYLSGNIVEYRKHLLEKVGAEKLAWIEGPHPQKHYSIPELKQLIAHYKMKCKELLTKGE
jgi:hypothetical protein